MSPEDALANTMCGGFLLCLDFPPGGEFSINTHAWTLGKSFGGLKMIPTTGAPHLVTMTAGPRAPSRTGIFLTFKKGEVRILRWDASEEVARCVESTDKDYDRLVNGVLRFEYDATLAPFPGASLNKCDANWQLLLGLVDTNTLQRCNIPIGFSIVPGESVSETEDSKFQFLDLDYFQKKALRVIQKNSENISGSYLTNIHMDGSKTLDQFFNSMKSVQEGENHILAELQLSFVLFVFEHWKKMLLLLCSCESFVEKRPGFFKRLIETIRSQLKYFFIDPISSTDNGKGETSNFMHEALRSLVQITNISEGIEQQIYDKSEIKDFIELSNSANSLNRFIKRQFGIKIYKDEGWATAENADAAEIRDLQRRVTQMGLKSEMTNTVNDEIPISANKDNSDCGDKNNATGERMSWMLSP